MCGGGWEIEERLGRRGESSNGRERRKWVIRVDEEIVGVGQEASISYLFHEWSHKISSNDILCFSPHAKGIVYLETLYELGGQTGSFCRGGRGERGWVCKGA